MSQIGQVQSITMVRFELLLFSICFGPFYFEAIAEAEAVFYMPNPSQVFSFGADVLALSSYFACKKCLLLLELNLLNTKLNIQYFNE